MKPLAFLLVAALVAVPLAGCARQDATTPTGATPPTGTATPTVTATPTSTPLPSPTPPSVPSVDPTPTISTVRVGTDAAYPPFENVEGGKIVGFDVDVLVEVGNRSGFTVAFENAAFDAILPAVQNGQFDAGMSAFTITDERKQQVDFSVSYYDNELMAAVATATQGINSVEDLRGRTVCTQKTTTSVAYLQEQLGNDVTILQLDTFPPCVDAVKRGDAVAMMIDRAAVRDLIGKSNGELKEAFTASPDPPEQFGVAVRKGNNVLLLAINAALTSMKQDGTLDRLQDKWNV